MVVPTSIDLQFRRLEKNLRDLKRSDGAAFDEESGVIVAEICNSCVLTLDKVMNALWDAKATRRVGKGKPRVYFPTSETSRQGLAQKFQQYQLADVEKYYLEIFNLIESVQPYQGNSWLAKLSKIAQIRHEKYPSITEKTQNGLGFGMGQDLYIESMEVGKNGQIRFNGHGINRETGNVEPVRVKIINEVRSVLEGTDEDPYKFCAASVAKTKGIVAELYKMLRKTRAED